MPKLCCGFAHRGTFLFLGLALGLGGGFAIWGLRDTKQQPPPAPVETVEILVAAKDLNTGTAFTSENNDRLTKLVAFPKSELPAEYVTDRKFFVGKRIGRPLREGEPFKTSDVWTPQWVFEEGKDIMSIAQSGWGNNPIGPGSRVDILAVHPGDYKSELFTLLPDMQVLAVKGISGLRDVKDDLDFRNVSVAVDQQQATILRLAQQQNCKLDLLLRNPDSQPRKNWSYEATLKRLEPRWEVAPQPRVKE